MHVRTMLAAGLAAASFVAFGSTHVATPPSQAEAGAPTAHRDRAALPWATKSTGRAAMLAAAGPGWWRVNPKAKPGLELVSADKVRERLYELSFTSPFLPGPQAVRVLLPRGYDRQARRYPTLYLLHGCCNGASPGGARNWTDALNAETATKDDAAIVVMPDGGAGGMYVDWYDGSWNYESFIIGQLLPWVDEHLRTDPRREHRAVAGVSMGGFGAMYYATRHPDLFSSQAAFSGIVDLLRPEGESSSFVEGFIAGFQALATGDDSVPGKVFGDLATQAINWHDHNPADLAVNLTRNNRQPFLMYGDPPLDPVEGTAALENHALEDALRGVGIDPRVVRVPLGYHGKELWNPALRRWMSIVTAQWRSPLPTPRRFTYTSTRGTFSIYDYTVVMNRPVREFATLADVGRGGLRLVGSGTAVVTTAARYVPGANYVVDVADGHSTLRADRQGRLTFTVPLGPSATVDEFGPGDVGERPSSAVVVRIERASR